MEIVLGAAAFDAELAERYGWINRALPDDQLDAFVERFAFRMASFPADALRMAKKSVHNAELHLHDGLREEAYAFSQLLSDKEAIRRMKELLANGEQTREGELNLEATVDRVL